MRLDEQPVFRSYAALQPPDVGSVANVRATNECHVPSRRSCRCCFRVLQARQSLGDCRIPGAASSANYVQASSWTPRWQVWTQIERASEWTITAVRCGRLTTNRHGMARLEQLRLAARMATTLWDSPFNGLAHREVAVNDEGNGCHAIDGNPCDGFGCDVLPTVADYLVRDQGAIRVPRTQGRITCSRIRTSGAARITASAICRAAWPPLPCCHRYPAWLVRSLSFQGCPDR